jgi:iron(III) transport system ATP-binding protein
MTAITIEGLSKGYGPVQALKDVSFTVPAGARSAIVGASGSGKTTLLRIIAGFEQADAGRVRLDGDLLVDGMAGVPAHKREIGVVAQDGSLFPHLSIAENIGFGLPRGLTGREAEIARLLDLVELPAAMAERRPHQLSGGQQQRVALARALARKPRLMLLDEPFSALDTGLREAMRRSVVAVLRDQGIGALLVTHDQAEALSFADHLVVLREGRLVQAGPPRDLYAAPVDPDIARFLGEAIILDAEIAAGRARCLLGEIAVPAETRQAKAQIMLRPEQIRLAAAGATGTVSDVEFGGGSAVVTIVLNAAAEASLRLRISGIDMPSPGETVALEVVGPAYVFDQHTLPMRD